MPFDVQPLVFARSRLVEQLPPVGRITETADHVFSKLRMTLTLLAFLILTQAFSFLEPHIKNIPKAYIPPIQILPSVFSFILVNFNVLAGLSLYYYTKSPYPMLLNVVFLFLIIPIVDFLAGKLNPVLPLEFRENENSQEEKKEDSSCSQNNYEQYHYYNELNYSPEQEWWFYGNLVFLTIMSSIVFFISMYCVNSMEINSKEFWFLAFSLMPLGGFSVTVAHELIHKKTFHETIVGKWLLFLTFYLHFAIEHVHGHHKSVATPEDIVTARYNESIYSFWLRTIPGEYINAWAIENRRISRIHKRDQISWLRWFWLHITRNKMVKYTVLMIGFAFMIKYIFGIKALALYGVSSLLSQLLVQSVNYIEHYALQRKQIGYGPNNEPRYEKVKYEHAWESRYVISNAFTVNLPLHPDHHVNPRKNYGELEGVGWISPQLPFPYPTMFMVSMVPPLFRKVVHPCLEEFQQSMVNSNFSSQKKIKTL
eukprot:gb/GECH01012613.1/.p1 GENE.gb/GECH01012613.1/~~gb/GECH01012613.1/.p1  ORF type:complete len:482 (+),score=80.43 gb/GECH01012613.1/:1-1446(+)